MINRTKSKSDCKIDSLRKNLVTKANTVMQKKKVSSMKMKKKKTKKSTTMKKVQVIKKLIDLF